MLKGNRKIWFMGGVFVLVEGLAAAMVFNGNLDAVQWLEVTKWLAPATIAGFGIGNGLEHLGKRNTVTVSNTSS